MTTITLPLWGWVLVALAALVLVASLERDRVRADVATVVGRFMRRGRGARRRPLAWDCAVMRQQPSLLQRLVLPAKERLRAFARSALRILTAPWRGLCARAAERRLNKISAAPPPQPTVWAPIDYSAKRAKALEQLGDDYVLAKPLRPLSEGRA